MTHEIATLAGGCFWCLEAVFDQLKGVQSVESGYMGGASPAVESGRAEVNMANRRGDGAYGFPVGPGVGVPGGEHQPVAQKPDELPRQYPER